MVVGIVVQSTMNSVMGEWSALVLRAFQAPGSTKSPWSVVFRWVLQDLQLLPWVKLYLHVAATRVVRHERCTSHSVLLQVICMRYGTDADRKLCLSVPAGMRCCVV